MKWYIAPATLTAVTLVTMTYLLGTSTAMAEGHGDYTNGQGIAYSGDGMVSWVDGKPWSSWETERKKREQSVHRYLYERDPELSAAWGFRQQGNKQNAYIGWKWFEETPVGFGGVPYVVLKTILDLDQDNCKHDDYNLCALVSIWQQPAAIPAGLSGKALNNLDHLGFGPHPADYRNGAALNPAERKWPLPYGFVFQSGNPKYGNDEGPFFEPIDTLKDSTYEEVGYIELAQSKWLEWKAKPEDKISYLRRKLEKKRQEAKAALLLAKVANKLSSHSLMSIHQGKGDSDAKQASLYDDDYAAFGRSTGLDRVFFSCAACHVGRVLVENSGVAAKIVHLPGSPNTEAEAQYFSQLLMRTGAALVESGLDLDSPEFAKAEDIKPNSKAVVGLYRAMIDKVLADPASFYGDSEAQRLRAYFMVWRASWNFPGIVKDLIGTAVKTHFIYYGIASQHAYNADKQLAAGRISDASEMPDLMNNRVGQMDAFGMASGLAAIHTLRPDQSYLRFIFDDVRINGTPVLGSRPGANPVFTGFADRNPDLARDLSGLQQQQQVQQAGDRVLANILDWAPPIAAPIDIKSLNFSRDRALANWDGNQGANARTLASGTSATGDPRKVNVEIHEPLNPFINNLPPFPYQWEIDPARARKGRQLFYDEVVIAGKPLHCAGCHQKRNAKIYPAVSKMGVDESRSTTNTSVSRNMLAALVLEACSIYRNNNPGKPGNDFCMPEGDTQEQKLTNYFADVPARVAQGNNGYKADMLHGIWARAPYLHNGSVPTLGALLCTDARPEVFIRGNIAYDTEMVGFEWHNAPVTRYNSIYESVQFKNYNTRQLSRSNVGHEFSNHLCPDLQGLDPGTDRQEIADRLLASPVGDLLEYLKTL